MKSKLGVGFPSRRGRACARAGFASTCLVAVASLFGCAEARAGSVLALPALLGVGTGDYTASYSQNFYADGNKNAANTTGNWATSYGYLSLKSTSGFISASSFEVVDRSSLLANFRGPVSLLANDNSVPIIGSKSGSLNFPLSATVSSKMQDLSGRLTGFASSDLRALGFSGCGDVDQYISSHNAAAADGGAMQLGDDNTHIYILAAGDSVDQNVATPAVRLNKIKLISYAADGSFTTRTEDVSAGLSALGFEAITDVSCSDTQCLLAGKGGKLAAYDGRIFTDLSAQLHSRSDDLEIAWNGEYFLIVGSDYLITTGSNGALTGRYLADLYEYRAGTIERITDNDLAASDSPLRFELAFSPTQKQWLILRGGKSLGAYLYADGMIHDVTSILGRFYPGNFSPVAYAGSGAWYIANAGMTDALVRFDGDFAQDVRSQLGIKEPVYVIGSNGDSALLFGGGMSSAPKLYKVSETVAAAATSFQPTGVVESLKVNPTSGNITSAYLKVNQEVEEGTALRYFLSADGGNHWQEVTLGEGDVSTRTYFQFPGSDLRWKVELETVDNEVSPLVYGIAIYYTEGGAGEVAVLKNWDLARSADGTKVYVILNGKKKWIASAEEFTRLGYKWSEVKTVAPDLLDTYAEVKLVKAKGTDAIYYVTNSGLKKLVLNDAVFRSYNNRYADVVELDPGILALYPAVKFIKAEDGRIYQITGATKKWVTSPEEFSRLGGKWSEVAPVNATELAAYADLSTAVPAAASIVDGDLIRAVGSPDVYIVKLVGSKRFKRLVLTPEVFKSYGHLKWENIKAVDAATLGDFAESRWVSVCSRSKADADCDIYLLTSIGDWGNKEMLAKADFVSGKYDLDAVYLINATDFQSYRNCLVWGDGSRQVQQAQLLTAMLEVVRYRYRLDLPLDRQRFSAVMEKVVLKERGSATTEMRASFQQLLVEAGISDTAREQELAYLMQQGLVYEKLLLQDAVASFDAGKVVESAPRRMLREELTRRYPLMQGDFALIDSSLTQVIQGKPVQINHIDTYFSREGVNAMLEIFDDNLSVRVGQLF